jgi:hypothetical protein
MPGRRDGFVGVRVDAARDAAGARTPSVAPTRWASCMLGYLLVTVTAPSLACTRNTVADGDGAPPGSAEAPGRARTLRVGNPSRGVDDQPDYDAMARELRSRIAARLPDPLPTVAEACRDMLGAAATSYAAPEGEAPAADAVVRAVVDADRSGCERETSPAAATCVAMLLREAAGEYPWLLDQCSRAFPKL